MTDRIEDDAFAENLRRDVESAMRPAVDEVIDQATKPYRRIVFWMGIGYLILTGLSIMQAIHAW